MAKYKITRKIGAGAFGNVYLFQTGHARSEKFALKTVNILRLNMSEEDQANEGSLMLKLCHTHLVYCYDAFICSPHLYLIMELCCHGSLEGLLLVRKSLIPEEQILSWMAQLADVLRYLHALKVIHRDLKPANIFLDEHQNMKLGDLGVARQLDHTVQERQTSAGTLPYMSPEAFTGLPYNYKTDIWGLGCCIHEAMTLEKTFQGQSWAELHHMITSAKVPEIPSLYQRKLKKLVLSLLNSDSSKRPDALEILFVLFQLEGKQFSSNPYQPVNTLPFDHRKICDVVKSYEISSGSETILPLRGDNDSFEDNRCKHKALQDSRPSHQCIPDNGSCVEESNSYEKAMRNNYGKQKAKETFQDKQSANCARPLPVPRVKKKNKILKSLKKHRTNDVETYEKDKSDTHSDRLSEDISNSESSYQQDDSLNSPQNQLGGWTQEYMDTLAKDSIQWLRDRFKPRSNDSQSPASGSTDNNDVGDDGKLSSDDDDYEDDDVPSGLVTLFTQSQTAVFINSNKSAHSLIVKDERTKP